MNLLARVREIGFLLLGVHALGVTGYVLIEGWTPFDALYMTVITIATVGYGETHELSTPGRAFTIALIFIGIGAFTYAVSSLAAYLVEAQLFGTWGKRRMERSIAELRDHIIVCGGGDTAHFIMHELVQTRTPFVIVIPEPSDENRFRDPGQQALYLVGDPSDTEVLRRAGIEYATGLVACMADDRENLLTVFEARHLNPAVRIVSRLVSDDAHQRLLRAGADSIVPMQRIGALRLASEILRPHVVSVLDQMLREPGQMRVQQIPVGLAGAGKTLSSLRLQEQAGVIIFAIRQSGSLRHVFNPAPDTVIEEGDVLIGCAEPDQLETARQLAGSGSRPANSS